jgi:hypothetical protein
MWTCMDTHGYVRYLWIYMDVYGPPAEHHDIRLVVLD